MLSCKFETTATELPSILDSSLKSRTRDFFKLENPKQFYNCKVIDCGDYYQVYYYENGGTIKNQGLSKDIKPINLVDTEDLYKKENEGTLKTILLSNAIRSNFACQRLAKCNSSKWESFITLTFKENIIDIDKANKIFANWVRQIKKYKKNFMYLAVPEFQKRGAVHYHILCNLSKEDNYLIYLQENSDEFYDVRFWNKGFTCVDFVKNDYKKIYSYICKYMTKDIDNKLFGRKRYLFSQNLKKPSTNYLDLTKEKDFDYFLDISKSNIEYSHDYIDIYTGQLIKFVEYKK